MFNFSRLTAPPASLQLRGSYGYMETRLKVVGLVS